MSKENKEIKMSFPMFTSIEEAQLENTLNFHLDEFVNEINKTMTRDKDIIILKKVIEKQAKEIEDLKNVKIMREYLENKFIPKDKIREIFYKYEKLDCITMYDFSNFVDDIKKLLEE